MFSQIQRELEAQELKKAQEQKIIIDKTGRINEKWMLHLFRWMYSFTLGSNFVYDPWQFHSNIFIIYVYSVITSSQALLQKILEIYSSDEYISELKKSKLLTEQEYEFIITEIRKTLTRFNVYDATIKQIFNIPLNESSWKKISEKFIPFIEWNDDQTTQLIKKVLNPVFGYIDDYGNIIGYFHKNIYKSPIFAVSCNINKNTLEKSYCKSYTIENFPYPEQDKYVAPPPDCITPIILWNELVGNIKFSIKLAQNLSLFEKIFNKMVGYSYGEYYGAGKEIKDVKDMADQKFEDAKQAANNAITAGKEIAKKAADIGKSFSNFIQNPPKPSDIINKIAITGGIVLAGYILMNEITS